MNYTNYQVIRGMEERINIKGRMVRLNLIDFNETPLYGIAKGGFGCLNNSFGNAIFVGYIGNSEREVLNRLALNISNTQRWEAYYENLEVADLPEGQIIEEED